MRFFLPHHNFFLNICLIIFSICLNDLPVQVAYVGPSMYTIYTKIRLVHNYYRDGERGRGDYCVHDVMIKLI